MVMAGRRGERRRSLVGIWLGESTHPLLALGIALVFEAGAMGGLVWWAGWRNVWHALAVENSE